MKFLEVENLTTRYQTSKGQVHALDDVNFSLEKGESVGIAGESACGKSTLGLSMIRMIQGGKIVSGKIIGNNSLQIRYFSIDSRTLSSCDQTIFISLKGERHDAHR